MSEMTLKQLREQIAGVATGDDYMLQGWIAAIDAHLAQHAQAVDVGAIREVIEVLNDVVRTAPMSNFSRSRVGNQVDKLTRTLSGEKAGRVDGWVVAAHRFLVPDGTAITDWDDGELDNGKRFPDLCPPVLSVQYAYIPASPTPDKEGK